MPRASSADKILHHAAELFATHGFSGTIMDELAKQAKVNKATIYYHFKDKEYLYEEVLVRHLEALVEALTLSVAKEREAQEKLRSYVTNFAKGLKEKRVLTSIIMREIAGGGDRMPNRAKAQMHKILMIINGIIKQGVEEGNFIDVNVLNIHMMLIGSLSFYISSEPLRKKMVSTDAKIQNAFVNSTIDEVSTDLYEMLKRALLKETKEKK